MIDLALTHHAVVQIAVEASGPDTAWSKLIAYLEELAGKSLALSALPAEADVLNVRDQVEFLVKAEPPSQKLNAVYFGLFDARDENDLECIGYYISGVSGFDPDDGDTLCNPAWWPEGRYLSSVLLDAIKEAELSAERAGDDQLQDLLGYAGQLGAALIVSRFSSRGLFPALSIIVGFDSGDFAVLPS